jgi:hypothetical protein
VRRKKTRRRALRRVMTKSSTGRTEVVEKIVLVFVVV